MCSTASSNQGWGDRKQRCLLALFWQPPEQKTQNPQGQHVPCWPHRELKNMFMSSQQEAPGLVTPLFSLPFKPAGRSSVKVQAHIQVCSRSCLQFASAWPEGLTSVPRSPENEGEPGMPLCSSPCPASERAALPAWVGASKQAGLGATPACFYPPRLNWLGQGRMQTLFQQQKKKRPKINDFVNCSFPDKPQISSGS